MTTLQKVLTIAVVALGTQITRFSAFLVFPEGKTPPKFISYLASVLPCAVIGMLVVYCLKDVEVVQYPYGLPELIACAVTAGLHFWKRNYLISIAVGTVLYMLLVQLVF